MLRQRVAVTLALCAALWLGALLGEARGNDLGPFGAIPAYSSLAPDGDEAVEPVFVESAEATSVAGFGDFLKKAAAKVKNFFKKVGSKVSGAFKNLANHFKSKSSGSKSSSSGGMKTKLGAALGKADAGIKFAPKKASPPPPPPPKFGKLPEPAHSPAPLKYPPPPSSSDPFAERLSSRSSSEFDATSNVARQMKQLQQDAMKDAFKRMAAVISVNQDPQDYRMLTEKGEVGGLTRQVLGPHPAQEIEEERQAEIKRKNPQNKPKIHVVHTPEVRSDKKPKKVLTLRKGRVLREAKAKEERKKMEKTLHEAEELEQDPGVGEDDPIPGFHEPPGTVPRNDWDDKLNRWRHRRRAMREREQ